MLKTLITSLILATTASIAIADGSIEFDAKKTNNFAQEHTNPYSIPPITPADTFTLRTTLKQSEEISKNLKVGFVHTNVITEANKPSIGLSGLKKISNLTTLNVNFQNSSFTFKPSYKIQTKALSIRATHKESGIRVTFTNNQRQSTIQVNKKFFMVVW